MTLPDLIAALESFGGPCRDMDDKIATAIWGEQPRGNAGEPKTLCWEMSPGFYCSCSPRFTASLDAALTLVPEGWHWQAMCTQTAMSDNTTAPFHYATVFKEPDLHHHARAATAPIAVCIAALRARLAEGR